MNLDDDRRSMEGAAPEARSGRMVRRRVHTYLQAAVLPRGERASVLELGCQGENAVFLGRLGHQVVATNSCERMLEGARSFADAADVQDRVVFRSLDFRSDRPTGFEGAFDLVLGDFGALNTLEPNELRHLAVAATTWVREGGRAVFLIMPPVCVWESISCALRGRWSQAGQRSASAIPRSSTGEPSSPTWYHDPGAVGRSFAPSFKIRHVEPLGLALPPFGRAGPVAGSPPVLTLLAAVERVGRVVPGLARFSDHYLVDLERTPAITVARHVTQLAPRRPRLAAEPMGSVATRREAG